MLSASSGPSTCPCLSRATLAQSPPLLWPPELPGSQSVAGVDSLPLPLPELHLTGGGDGSPPASAGAANAIPNTTASNAVNVRSALLHFVPPPRKQWLVWRGHLVGSSEVRQASTAPRFRRPARIRRSSAVLVP